VNGSRFFGMVWSVQEDRSCSPQRWIVTIVPTVEKPALVGWRYSSRLLDGPADAALRGHQGPQELPICRPKVAYKGSRTDSKFSIVRLGCI